MQTKQLSFFLSLLLTLCLFRDTQAQQAGRIESMKLLTPDAGWAATKHKLFWTTNGGGRWSDITPKLEHKQQTLSSVFFLDSSTGWALLGCSDGRDPIADDVCFEFASTTNAGENWSVVHPKIVDPVPPSVITEDGQGFSDTTFLDFADAQHGWAILKRSLPVGRSSGEMLRTVDGGRTWMQLAKGTLPMAENLYFATPKDGWMAGGPDDALFATHNGGDNWEPVSLMAPEQAHVPRGAAPEYDLPKFEANGHGFLMVGYSDGSTFRLELFSSQDWGRTWQPQMTLPTVEGSAVTITRGTWIAASISRGLDRLTFTRLPLRAGAVQIPAAKADIHVISGLHYLGSLSGSEEISAFDESHCWILAGKLLSSSDGGAAWTDITPGGAPTPAAALGEQGEEPMRASGRKQAEPPASVSRSGAVPATGVSTHLGFDISRVPCSTPLNKCGTSKSLSWMQTWMNSSPYYDTSLYLPGSPNRGTDPNLNVAWVQGVQQQGWGLIPIWFGLQSPCVNDKTGITQFFSATPATASTQGAQQADLAVAAAQSLGVTSGIIYSDIESYTVDHSTCSLAVQAYVDGFVSEIHVYSGYLAAIYANAGPITSDISTVSSPPDDIWITKTPGSGNPPQVTIWNLGLKDALYPNGQRLHQFLINQSSVTWGAIPLSIDEDVDNGPVGNANNGAKTPSYAYTSLTYPGSTQTCPTGINDMAGGAFISNNNPTSVGEIVGEFEDSQGQLHGFSLIGTTWAQIDYPGAVWTVATGINNAGQIVGAFLDSLDGEHGFKWNSGSPTTIDYPGANGSTEVFSINDAGQIVGSYQDSSGVWHGFLSYSGKFYSFSYPASNETLADGINGDAIITGHYTAPNAGSSYSYSPLPPNWTGSFSAISYPGGYPAFMYGVNNDGEFTGYAGSASGNVGLTLSNDVFTSLQFPGQSETFMFSANDFGQIAGYYYSQSDLCVGFVAIPQ